METASGAFALFGFASSMMAVTRILAPSVWNAFTGSHIGYSGNALYQTKTGAVGTKQLLSINTSLLLTVIVQTGAWLLAAWFFASIVLNIYSRLTNFRTKSYVPKESEAPRRRQRSDGNDDDDDDAEGDDLENDESRAQERSRFDMIESELDVYYWRAANFPSYTALTQGAIYFSDVHTVAAAIDYGAETIQVQNLVSIGASIGSAAYSTGKEPIAAAKSVASGVYSTGRLWVVFIVLATSSLTFILYSDTITTIYHKVWVLTINAALFQKFGHLLLSFAASAWNNTAPFIYSLYKSFKYAANLPTKLFVIFEIGKTVGYLVKALKFGVSLLTSLFTWVFTGRWRYDNAPLDYAVGNFLSLASTIGRDFVAKSCKAFNYVTAPIFDWLEHPSTTELIVRAVNLPVVVVLQQLVVRIFFDLQAPDPVALDDYTRTLALAAGYAGQNLTLAIGNYWIGGNLSLYVNDVNGTYVVADQFSAEAYKIRVFRIPLLIAAGSVISAAAAPIWEALNLAFNTQRWINPAGYTFLTFDFAYANSREAVEQIGSILNVFPQCVVANSPVYTVDAKIYYGDIVSGLGRALIAASFVILDLVIGNIYFIVSGAVSGNLGGIGSFTSGYLIADGERIQEFENQLQRSMAGVRCAVSQLSPELGQSIYTLVIVIFDIGVLVLVGFAAYTQAAFVQGPDILDNLDPLIDEFEREAVKIADVANIIYRFSNDDKGTCESKVSLLCGFGGFVQHLVMAFAYVPAFFLRSVKNAIDVLVSTVYNLITRLELDFGTQTRASTKNIANEFFRVGEKFGVMVASIVPLYDECSLPSNKFCAARNYYPAASPRNPVICGSAFLSLLFANIGTPVRIFGLVIEIGVNFQFTDLSEDGIFIQLFKSFANVVRNRIIAPICPAGDMLSCYVTAYAVPTEAPSTILCLINSSIVDFIDKASPILIRFIQLIVKLVRLLFSNKIDAGLIDAFIKDLFAIWADGFVAFTQWIFGAIFGGLLDLISAICTFFGDTKCTDSINAFKSRFGFLTTPGAADNYYAATEDKKKRKRSFTEGLFSEPSATHKLDNPNTNQTAVLYQLWTEFGYLYTGEVYNATTGEYRNMTIMRDFSVQEIPNHMATYVNWTMPSRCGMIVPSFKGMKMSELTLLEQAELFICVQQRAFIVIVAASIPGLAFLPRDIVYNFHTLLLFLFQTIRTISLFFQFLSDKNLPHEYIMTDNYRKLCSYLLLNTTHLVAEFREVYPVKHGVAVNASQLDLMPFEMYRANLTLLWYYARNFNDESPVHGETGHEYPSDPGSSFSASMSSLYKGSSNFIFQGLQLQQNYTDALVNTTSYAMIASGIDPVTNLSLSDGSGQSLEVVYRTDVVTNTRYEVFQAWGDAGTNVYDSKVNFQGAFLEITAFLQRIMNIFSTAVSIAKSGNPYYFRDMLELGNIIADADTNSLPAPAPDPDTVSKKRAMPMDAATEEAMTHPFGRHLDHDRKVLRKAELEKRFAAAPARKSAARFADLKESLFSGYAQMVDEFMHDNGAVLPDRSPPLKKRATTIDEDKAGRPEPEPFYNRTRTAKILVATVAATASLFKLNTTYVPLYCNHSKELAALCMKSDWRNAASYLSEHPELESAFQEFFNVSVISFWGSFLSASDDQARSGRTMAWNAISEIMDTGSDMIDRFNSKLEEHNVKAVIAPVTQKIASLLSSGDSGGGKGTMSSSDAFALQHGLKPGAVTVNSAQEQARRSDFYREELSRAAQSGGTAPASRLSTWTAQNVPFTSADSGAGGYGPKIDYSNVPLRDRPFEKLFEHILDAKNPLKPPGSRPGYRKIADQATFYQSWMHTFFGSSLRPDTLDDHDLIYGRIRLGKRSPQAGKDAKVERYFSDTLKTIRSLDTLDTMRYWYEQTHLEDPDTMSMANPSRTPRMARIVNMSDPAVAVARAWGEFIREEKLIQDDVRRYRDMFQFEDPDALPYESSGLHGENTMAPDDFGHLSSRINGVIRKIEIKSQTKRRQTYQNIVRHYNDEYGAGLDESAVPDKMEVMGYKTATLRQAKTQSYSHKRRALVEYSNYELVDFHRPMDSTEQKEYEVVIKAEQAALAASAANPGSTRRGSAIVVKNDVVQFKFSWNPRSDEGSSDGGARTGPTLRSHFFFPVSLNESIDLFSRSLSCPATSADFCDQCLGLALIVENIKGNVLDAVDQYTTYVPLTNVANLAYIDYTFRTDVPAQMGFGDYPASLFDPEHSVWEYFRGLQSEIDGFETGDDGPKISALWVYITGIPFPDALLTNGSRYQDFLGYLPYRNNQSALPEKYAESYGYYNVLYIVQESLGIPLLQIVDTLFFYSKTVLPSFGEYAYGFFKCELRKDIDCSTRIYSLAGATYLVFSYGLVVIIPILLFGSIGNIVAAAMVLGPAAVALILNMSYGWSISCLPAIPYCAVQDAVDLLRFTVFTRCDPFLVGGLALNTDYNLNTCYWGSGIGFTQSLYNLTNTQASYEPQFANCYDFGMRNIYDVLEMADVVYESKGRDRPSALVFSRRIVDSFYGLIGDILGPDVVPRPALTRDFRSDSFYANYVSSKRAYSIMNTCLYPAAVAAGSFAGMAGLGAVIASSALVSLIATLAAQPIGLMPAILQIITSTGSSTSKRLFGTAVYNTMFDLLEGDNIKDTIFAPIENQKVWRKTILRKAHYIRWKRKNPYDETYDEDDFEDGADPKTLKPLRPRLSDKGGEEKDGEQIKSRGSSTTKRLQQISDRLSKSTGGRIAEKIFRTVNAKFDQDSRKSAETLALLAKRGYKND